MNLPKAQALFCLCIVAQTEVQTCSSDTQTTKKTTAEETRLPNLFAYSLQVFQCSHNQPLITADVYIDEISVP